MPSDVRSGGLAMLWKERADVCFKSFSNVHINMVVCEGIMELNCGGQQGFMDILMQV